MAGNLCRPRNQWPLEELIDRSLGIITNPAALDRLLKELSPSCRSLLAMIGHSRQPVWRVGNLVELSMAVGESDGLAPVTTLLESGLLYPTLTDNDMARKGPRLKSFSRLAGTVTRRFDLGIRASGGLSSGRWGRSRPARMSRRCCCVTRRGYSPADGLEWPLRLAVVWQQLTSASFKANATGGLLQTRP